MMDTVFWIKKIAGRFTSQRLELGHRWANVGQPVVSYYTRDQLARMLDEISAAEVLQSQVLDESRMAYVIKRVGMGIIVRKKPASDSAA